MLIQNLTKSFGSQTIIKNLTYSFPDKGIIALTGVNGAGKTTLLKIICGLEKADSGKILLPESKIIGYLPQEPNPNPKDTIFEECYAGNEIIYKMNQELKILEEELANNYSDEILEKFESFEIKFKKLGGYSFENQVEKILSGLGFDEEKLKLHPNSLSGGWRMRLELARLLIKQPDYLILDEPTNHLDLITIEWLEDFLKKFKNVILFVSHDEALLNNLPNKVLNLSQGVLKEYNGNYEDFLEQKKNDDLNREKNIQNIEKKVSQLKKFVERFGAKNSLASQAKNKEKMISRLNDDIKSLGPNIFEPEVNIKIPMQTESGKNVLYFDGVVGYNNIPLREKFYFHIVKGQKVAVIGENGLGKSTLIKTIIGDLPLISGKMEFGSNVNIGYYAQDQAKNLNEELNVLENMKEANPSVPEQQIFRILGSFLFKKDNIGKKVKVLSGGEKSRLSLACLLLKDVNFLILDEPTNHLDIMTCQILAQAISNFEGTVLFVSHNRAFIDTASTHLLNFEKDKVTMVNII